MPEVTSSKDQEPYEEPSITEASIESAKRSAVTARLASRDAARQAALEERHRVRQETSAENENVLQFDADFRRRAAEIEEGIAGVVPDSDRVSLARRLDALNEDVQRLTSFFADSKLFLPTFDVRRSQERIDALAWALMEKRNKVLPKKKFGFKKSENSPTATTTTTTAPTIAASSNDDSNASTRNDGNRRPAKTWGEGDCVVEDRTDSRVSVSGTDVSGRTVGLSRLCDCDVLVRGAPSSLHARDLQRCRIFCGPTSGAAFLDRCSDCVFVIAAQQIRIHETKNSRFHVHVASRTIVEDCSAVAFAPYALSYPGIESDYSSSGLDRERNNWRLVDDFNFLATGDVASPNWRLLSEDEFDARWESLEALLTVQGDAS